MLDIPARPSPLQQCQFPNTREADGGEIEYTYHKVYIVCNMCRIATEIRLDLYLAEYN